MLEIEESSYINQEFTEVRILIYNDLWKKVQKSKKLKKMIKKYEKACK